ncbi:hypothetical protein Dvina_48255 [Dactylosporangium vinaceum]|uniref:Peptidase C39 domain-containing protein n=1 Tax=Dactylosporangium vinaceum TaxID=53362 RepID=A0ABV5MNW6_9ACTN|nr:hypothetical protein [Dactylosporangium vinaceum]UAB95705.1 hypothetical protein Dvina_48255 [Dactylosporangium vinaceum]
MPDYSFVRQTDGFTCGPTVALVASAALDPEYGATVTDPAAEQHRLHRAANFIWPRKLGTTPPGVAAVISRHTAPLGVRYGWRVFRGDLAPAIAAVECDWPVGLLIGNSIPRHWILIIGHDSGRLQCFNPARGSETTIAVEDVAGRKLDPLGFPRAFALVLPRRTV